MLIHPDFLFLHVPKTGGWWVRHVLSQLGLGTKISTDYQHSAWRDLSPTHQRHPAFATLREPVSWYRSYLHYNIDEHHVMRPIFKPYCTREDRTDSLADVCRRMLNPSHLNGQPVMMMGPKRPAPIEWMLKFDVGPYTWMIVELLSKAGTRDAVIDLEGSLAVDALLDTSRIREGLQELLVRIEPRVGDVGRVVGLADVGRLTSSTPPENVNSDYPRLLGYDSELTSDRFDADLVSLIRYKERYVERLMGYSGDGTPAASAVTFPVGSCMA